MLSTADLKQIQDMCDDRYVTKDDCNDRHEKDDKEFAEIRIQLTKMNTMLSIQTKVMAFVATGIGGLLIGAIGKLIFK